MNALEKQIIDISYEKKLSHIGSCLNTVNYLDHIYKIKEEGDTVVLGNSHAALALYVILEKYGKGNARELVDKHGTHAGRDIEHDIHVSGGSLGQAETIAVGMAMADPSHNVYLVTSDGACAEGSVWEALAVARKFRLENLRIAVIANGYGGNGVIDVDDLDARLNSFYPTLVVRTNLFQYPDWIQGLAAHYVVMNEDQYKEISNV